VETLIKASFLDKITRLIRTADFKSVLTDHVKPKNPVFHKVNCVRLITIST